MFSMVKVMHKFRQKRVGPHFGRFFSQAHLFTLLFFSQAHLVALSMAQIFEQRGKVSLMN
jgi:hypothetical protein